MFPRHFCPLINRRWFRPNRRGRDNSNEFVRKQNRFPHGCANCHPAEISMVTDVRDSSSFSGAGPFAGLGLYRKNRAKRSSPPHLMAARQRVRLPRFVLKKNKKKKLNSNNNTS